MAVNAKKHDRDDKNGYYRDMKTNAYRNLNNGKLSLMNARTGRIAGHADAVLLTDARLVVREGGRRKVVETGTKNVHAWVQGTPTATEGFESYKGRTVDTTGAEWPNTSGGDWETLRYNPFKAGYFRREDGTPAHEADMVAISATGTIRAKGVR